VVRRKPQQLEIVVKDNGLGFDANIASHQSALGRLGLVGMRERIALVGGTLRIDTAPGAGTTVSATIPIPKVVADTSSTCE
jgi:signal transduction histidine kinase